MNYRNRMAQYAGRASVSLNTHLFFRGRTQEEDGYILFVRKNALQVLIPKFGLEGTIYLCGRKGEAHKSGIQFVFDEEVSEILLLIFYGVNANCGIVSLNRIIVNITKTSFSVLLIQSLFG